VKPDTETRNLRKRPRLCCCRVGPVVGHSNFARDETLTKLLKEHLVSSIVEIAATERNVLAPLFAESRHDTVLINTVLEGYFGVSCADSPSVPLVARLDSGAFTILGGNSKVAAVKARLRHAPIHYVTPENDEWRGVEYRRKGLGTAVGAKLVLHCLQGGIEPKWLAANAASEKLALKLGYESGETYETFEVEHET